MEDYEGYGENKNVESKREEEEEKKKESARGIKMTKNVECIVTTPSQPTKDSGNVSTNSIYTDPFTVSDVTDDGDSGNRRVDPADDSVRQLLG